MELSAEQCVPCRKGGAPLSQDEAHKLLATLPGWRLSADGKAIEKSCTFKNFAQALAFVNQVGQVAEAQNHHPDITLGWGYATIRLTTHAIGGLHRNDYIIAAKIDTLQ